MMHSLQGPPELQRWVRRWIAAVTLTCLAALAVLLLTPTHACEWMREVDPSIRQLPDDPLRDVRLLGTGLVVALATAVCASAAWRSRRWAALAPAAGLWVLWWGRFAG